MDDPLQILNFLMEEESFDIIAEYQCIINANDRLFWPIANGNVNGNGDESLDHSVNNQEIQGVDLEHASEWWKAGLEAIDYFCHDDEVNRIGSVIGEQPCTEYNNNLFNNQFESQSFEPPIHVSDLHRKFWNNFNLQNVVNQSGEYNQTFIQATKHLSSAGPVSQNHSSNAIFQAQNKFIQTIEQLFQFPIKVKLSHVEV